MFHGKNIGQQFDLGCVSRGLFRMKRRSDSRISHVKTHILVAEMNVSDAETHILMA
jgi:hypothetical protein